MQSEDLTTAPNSQLTASPTILAAISFVGAPLLTIILSWLIDRMGGGDALKDQIQIYLLGAGGLGALTGGVGVVARGLKLTDAKIKNLTPRDLPETISAGGNVTLQNEAGKVRDDLSRITSNYASQASEPAENFDLSSAIQRALVSPSPSIGTDAGADDETDIPDPTPWGEQ